MRLSYHEIVGRASVLLFFFQLALIDTLFYFLIFCCSAGTEYEDYLDRLGEIEESYYLEFVRKYGQDKMTVDPFFIHVFCRAGWQTIYEVVMHNRTYKEAQSFMDSTVLFNRAGWKAVMGIEK